MNARVLLCFAASCALAYPTTTRAHGATEIVVGSTAAGGGALAIAYDFGAVTRTTFSSSIGPLNLYSGIYPSMTSLDFDTPPLYVLAEGTEVSLVISGIDEGRTSIKVDATALTGIGDTAPIGVAPFEDVHPTYQLLLAQPQGEFGEGTLSFRLTATGPTAYEDSAVYTVKISNGPLPPPAYNTISEDRSAVACSKKASKAIAKFVASKQKLLGKCLDKLQTYRARLALSTPPGNVVTAEIAAEKACADVTGVGDDSRTMLGRIEAAREKAFTAIRSACGFAGSDTLSDHDIRQQLGLAACRAEELVASIYGLARTDLDNFPVRASQGGDSVADHLPCLYLTVSD